MNYYELSFTYTSPIEKEIINDVLAAELGEIGFEGFTESEKGLLGYISEALYDKKTLDDKTEQKQKPPLLFPTIHNRHPMYADILPSHFCR